ncbi:hypothetical protein HLBS07_19690 [Vibrio alginolyticus]|nr:hypothetical protein HLBS07_19690 [Vibrio alginolyticus]
MTKLKYENTPATNAANTVPKTIIDLSNLTPRAANAQLSSEQLSTKAAALRHKHETHRKPKLPRVANLLKLFVMRFFGNAKFANENITLNTGNYKRAGNFL